MPGPCLRVSFRTAARSREPPDAPPTRTILLVDDDHEILESMRMVLENKGFRVLAARDGNAGLMIAERENPDLLVLDMMMPKKSGFLVLEKLKSRPGGLIPTIMITGNEGSRHRAYAEMLGVRDYIRKPFAMEKLVRAVERIMGIKPRAVARATTKSERMPANYALVRESPHPDPLPQGEREWQHESPRADSNASPKARCRRSSRREAASSSVPVRAFLVPVPAAAGMPGAAGAGAGLLPGRALGVCTTGPIISSVSNGSTVLSFCDQLQVILERQDRRESASSFLRSTLTYRLTIRPVSFLLSSSSR